MRNIREAISDANLTEKYDKFVDDLYSEYFDKKLYKGTSNTS